MKPSETTPAVDWTRAKSLFAELKTAACRTVSIQILIGRELASIKNRLGFVNGRNQWVGHGVRPSKTWDQWCEDELAASRRSADRWIGCFIAAKARAKRRKDAEALALLEAEPSELTESQISLLADCVHRLVDPPDGESQPTTQWQLLAEIGLVSQKPIAKGDGNKAGKIDPAEMAAELRVKCLFDQVKSGLSAARRTLHTAASGDGFREALAKLHLVSSDPSTATLQALKEGFEQFRDQLIPELSRDLESTARNVSQILKLAEEVMEEKMRPVAVRRPRKTSNATKS
jgi:hypothetical protein